MNTPIIPWPGGKRRLAKHILPLLNRPHSTYVEPFAGGAAIFFMRSKPAKIEVLNDIHSEIVKLYRCLQHHLNEFVRQFRWALTSREIFKWMQKQDVETLTDIQRAARFYYLQKLSFGSVGQSFGCSPTRPKRINLLRIEEELSIAHLRLANVVIENLPWQECMRRYDTPETLFYLDPPYLHTRGYGVPFEIDQYEEIASLMRSMRGDAVLSINDHPDIRSIFNGFNLREIQTTYTIGKDIKLASELIILSRTSQS